MTITQDRPSVSTMLAVDFPHQGEKITSPQYTVRLNAPDDVSRMDISIDQGDWKPCRKAAGYWWYDWSGYESGEHAIIARIQVDGKIVNCEPHEFQVKLPR